MKSNDYKVTIITTIVTTLISSILAGGFVYWSTNKQVHELKSQVEEARIYNEITNLKSLQDLVITLSLTNDYSAKNYILQNYDKLLNDIIESSNDVKLISKLEENKLFLETLHSDILKEYEEKIHSEILELIDDLGDINIEDQNENIERFASLLSINNYEDFALDTIWSIDNYPGVGLYARNIVKGISTALIYDNAIEAFKIYVKKNNVRRSLNPKYQSIMEDIYD